MSTKIGNSRTGSDGTTTPKGRAARERIYVSSIRLIQAGGYESLTVPAICAAAGVSVGAFYHHFESKSDILLRYVSEESDLLMEYYRGLEALPRAEALLRSVEYFFSFFAVKGRSFVAAFLGIIFSSGGAYYDMGRFSIVAIIEDALSRGAAAGEFRAVDERIVGLARGVILDLMVTWCVATNSDVATNSGVDVDAGGSAGRDSGPGDDPAELPAAGRARMAALLDLLRVDPPSAC